MAPVSPVFAERPPSTACGDDTASRWSFRRQLRVPVGRHWPQNCPKSHSARTVGDELAVQLPGIVFEAASDPEDVVIYDEPQEAVELVTLELPESGGQLIFYDETPESNEPSLFIVVREKRRSDTLDQIIRSNAGPLEIFRAFAPRRMPIPDRILQYEETRPALDDPVLGSDQHVYWPGTVDLPTVEEDDWGGCEDIEEWQAGFNSYVNDFLAERATQVVEIGTDGAPETWYGDFGTNDAIWAGVCMQSGVLMWVSMHYRDQYGNWQPVGGATLPTLLLIEPGERYLYHSFKPYTSARRIRVMKIGDAWEGGNFAIISGAWTENFNPDSWESAP